MLAADPVIGRGAAGIKPDSDHLRWIWPKIIHHKEYTPKMYTSKWFYEETSIILGITKNINNQSTIVFNQETVSKQVHYNNKTHC